MDREGLHYLRQENCFPWVEDIPRAQQLFQEQLQVNWSELLQPFAHRLNPLHEEIFRRYPTQYYWSSFQCEWATDILFRPGTLERLAPLLLQHGMLSFSSPDVLQFLGHRINSSGQIPGRYSGELTTDFKSRATGDRVKYRIDGNSLKGYGKASTPMGDLYRVETLTQHVGVFKTFRPKEGGPEDDLRWRPMRRGVADLHRRAEVSQKANERYGDALSAVDDSTRFSEFTRTLEQPCQYRGRRVRALHPFQTDDHQLLLVSRQPRRVRHQRIQESGSAGAAVRAAPPGRSAVSEREAAPFSGGQPKAENPPRPRADPEGPQNSSISGHFTRSLGHNRHPHNGPHHYRSP